MNSLPGGVIDVQQRASSNPWGAFVPHWSLEGYKDPPTDSQTLEKAHAGWKRMFGNRQVSLGIRDPVPFSQGAILGKGGLGVVYETNIDGVAVAWKRTYMRRIAERDLNEIKILGQISEKRHQHIIKLIGSYTHRQRSAHEIAILTWPVARCDLSALLHEIDLLDAWKSRDQPWDENDWSATPTNEERDAYDSLLKLEQLDQERPRVFTWHLREKVRGATSNRLMRSIGCIAEAVKYLHENGIRHKDIKPSQILLSSQGLWLTDFGMSKDFSHLTTSETSGGERATVKYHAPERARRENCGRPEDIFALGCTYLEMAYRIYGVNVRSHLNPQGAPMWSFQADLDSIDLWLWPLRESGEHLRVALSNIIEQMMAKDPRQRLSAEQITLDLLLTPESSDTFYGACCKPETTEDDLDDLDDLDLPYFDNHISSSPEKISFMLRRFLLADAVQARALARQKPTSERYEDEGWFTRDYPSGPDMTNVDDDVSDVNDFIDDGDVLGEEIPSSVASSSNAPRVSPIHPRRASPVSWSGLTDTLPLLDRAESVNATPANNEAQNKGDMSEEVSAWHDEADADDEEDLSSEDTSLQRHPRSTPLSEQRPKTHNGFSLRSSAQRKYWSGNHGIRIAPAPQHTPYPPSTDSIKSGKPGNATSRTTQANRSVPNTRSAPPVNPHPPQQTQNPKPRDDLDSTPSPNDDYSIPCSRCPTLRFVGVFAHRNLRRHMESVHGSDNFLAGARVQCRSQGCDATFRRDDARLVHERRNHHDLMRPPPLRRRRTAFESHISETRTRRPDT